MLRGCVEFRPDMLRVATRICGRDLALDVLQDVFARLWSHPHAFDPDRGSLRSYVLVVTRGAAIDTARRDTSARARDERCERLSARSSDDPADEMLHDESRRDVVRALATLGDTRREMLITAFYGNNSYRRVAEIHGLPEGTVKSHIRKALLELRGTLAEWGN